MKLQETTWATLRQKAEAIELKLTKNRFFDPIDRRATCATRKSKMQDFERPDDYFVERWTPCRVGRSKTERCPICDVMLATERVGAPLNRAIGIQIVGLNNMAFIPNAFPYTSNHWLLVRTDHYWGHYHNRRATQRGALRIKDVMRVALAWQSGSFFFNGMCGNSLEHFHVHFTSELLPLFRGNDNQWKQNVSQCALKNRWGCMCYRGEMFKFTLSNYGQVARVVTEKAQALTKKGADINYAGFVSKGVGHLLLIGRECAENKLGFGSSELAGLLTSADKKAYVESDLKRVCKKSIVK